MAGGGAMNLSSICRACLADLGVPEERISFSQEDVRIKFAICTMINVSPTDGLPFQICDGCWKRCTNWFEFRDMCQESMKKLKDAVESGHELLPIIFQAPIKVECVEVQVEEILEEEEVIVEEGIPNPNDDDDNPHLLKCPICAQHFTEDDEYDTHIKDHYKGYQGNDCMVCGKMFVGRWSMVLHTFEHGNQEVPCPICGKVFKGKSQLRVHTSKYHRGEVSTGPVAKKKSTPPADRIPEDILKCPVCKKIFESEKTYDSHIKAHYDGKKRAICLICSKSFKCMTTTVRHTHDHSSRCIACQHCQKTFKGRYQLSAHVNKYHPKEANKRSYEWRTESREEDWTEIETMEQQQVDEGNSSICMQCPICFEFSEEKDCEDHIREHYKDQTNTQCIICNEDCDDLEAAILHTTECHSVWSKGDEEAGIETVFVNMEGESEEPRHPNDLLECPICQEEFDEEKPYEAHIRAHYAGAKSRYCLVCKKEFCSIFSLVKHTHDHSKRCIPCRFCPKEFKGRQQLHVHQYKYHGSYSNRKTKEEPEIQQEGSVDIDEAQEGVNDRFECPICNGIVKDENALEEHLRMHYSGQTDFSCLVCGKSYLSLLSVVSHTHDHGNRTIPCRYCDRHFKGKWKLRAHLNKYHFVERAAEREEEGPKRRVPRRCRPSENVHICPFCGKVFDLGSRLNAHLKSHSDERPYKCQFCPASFRENRNLKVHVLKHTSEKSIKCPNCDLMFYHEKHLSDHLRRHAKERSTYKCGLCPRSFTYRSGLNEHMNSHTRERLFACDICEKVFERVSVLNRHRQIHAHGEEHPCHNCKKVFKRADHLKTHMKSHRNDRLAEEEVIMEWSEGEVEEVVVKG